MTRWTQHFVLDVEADGPCAGLFNMISFGLVSLEDAEASFLGEVAPIFDDPGLGDARDVVGVTFAQQKAYADPAEVMVEARA
jgi:hypothetical protein